MNVPYFPADSIRRVPFYVRWRFRLVYELLKKSRMKQAADAKAMGVYDFAKT